MQVIKPKSQKYGSLSLAQLERKINLIWYFNWWINKKSTKTVLRKTGLKHKISSNLPIILAFESVGLEGNEFKSSLGSSWVRSQSGLDTGGDQRGSKRKRKEQVTKKETVNVQSTRFRRWFRKEVNGQVTVGQCSQGRNLGKEMSGKRKHGGKMEVIFIIWTGLELIAILLPLMHVLHHFQR